MSFVMTVWHGSLDFIERLSKMEPSLIQIAEMLSRQIESIEADHEARSRNFHAKLPRETWGAA